MGSVCISNCVDDARVPMRATYVNLYKWPESDAEFVRSVSKKENRGENRVENRGDYNCRPRVVDSISCRQMYLRSYTFSVKKETVPEKTKKCFGKVKDKVINRRKRKVTVNGGGGRRKCAVMRKVKELSCAALFSFFRKLLACSTSVDVVERRDM